MIATMREQYCKAHIFSYFANERVMDDGLAQDQKFVKALCKWANKAPSTLAREMGLAATTNTRPFRGTATTRISAPTFDKLRLRYPDFPGWNNEEPDLPAAQADRSYLPVEVLPSFAGMGGGGTGEGDRETEIGRASCRERVCQYV